MQASKRCKICGEEFRPRPQKPQQSICSKPGCQRERRRRWLREKRETDREYRDNDVDGQRAWRRAHADYWRAWREAHPEYVERNRSEQWGRNARCRGHAVIANEYVSTPVSLPNSGTYLLAPAANGVIANEDAWMVEITVLSKG